MNRDLIINAVIRPEELEVAQKAGYIRGPDESVRVNMMPWRGSSIPIQKQLEIMHTALKELNTSEGIDTPNMIEAERVALRLFHTEEECQKYEAAETTRGTTPEYEAGYRAGFEAAKDSLTRTEGASRLSRGLALDARDRMLDVARNLLPRSPKGPHKF